MIEEISCLRAFETLKIKKHSHLIDVRTDFEWKNVGIPDLKSLNKDVFLIKWPVFLNKQFLDSFHNKLDKNFNHENHLFFICRSGFRSKIASELAFHLGYVHSYNIKEGFEGNRTGVNNWKNNLPWKYN